MTDIRLIISSELKAKEGSECSILLKGLCAMKGCMEGSTEQNRIGQDREHANTVSVSPNRTNQNQ